MFPMNRKPVAVNVEYSNRGRRIVKCFDDAHRARRFYAAKDRAGAFPRVVAAGAVTMSEPTTPVATEATTPAKPTAPKKTTAKKSAKKAAKAKPKAEKTTAKASKSKTVRHRAVEAIYKRGEMTAAQIAKSVGIEHGLKPTLDQEVERGHLRYGNNEDIRGVVYDITAKGRKAVEAGTVDPKRSK